MRHLRSVTAVALVGLLSFAGASALGSTPSPDARSDAGGQGRSQAAGHRTIDVVGDSITLQSNWGRSDQWRSAGPGVPATDHVERDFWLGYHFENVLAQESERAHGPVRRRPAVLVIAMGINNSLVATGGGWDGTDREAFRQLLHTPSPKACVVVVLPQAGPAASEADRLHVWVGRRAMQELSQERARTVVVDWASVVAAHPEYLALDGIHLASGRAVTGQLADPEAADAYAAVLWSGLARCPG